MVYFGFIIKNEGGKFSATGTTEEAKAIEGAGDSFDAIFTVSTLKFINQTSFVFSSYRQIRQISPFV